MPGITLRFTSFFRESYLPIKRIDDVHFWAFSFYIMIDRIFYLILELILNVLSFSIVKRKTWRSNMMLIKPHMLFILDSVNLHIVD